MNTRILAAIFAAAALPAVAQTATPRVVQRQANQEARIQEAKADGVGSARERARLAKAQNHQGCRIAKEKHDKQKKAAAS
jgi:hypothetical protein